MMLTVINQLSHLHIVPLVPQGAKVTIANSDYRPLWL